MQSTLNHKDEGRGYFTWDEKRKQRERYFNIMVSVLTKMKNWEKVEMSTFNQQLSYVCARQSQRNAFPCWSTLHTGSGVPSGQRGHRATMQTGNIFKTAQSKWNVSKEWEK